MSKLGTLLFVAFVLVAIPVSSPAATGDTLGSIATPYQCPQGLAFDGQFLWSVDRRSDMIYKIDPGPGTAVDSLPAPGYVPRGLAWDGQRLWCVDAEAEMIFAINPETRIIEKAIPCPVSRPMGLAWDGTSLWLAADRDPRLRQISVDDGTTITAIPAPTEHSGGLAYDGRYLWACDRFRDEIYMVVPETGDVIITFKTPGPHAWGLAWDGTYLWHADYQADRIFKLRAYDDAIWTRAEERDQHVEFIHEIKNFGPGPVVTLDIYVAVPGNLDNQELIEAVTFEPEPREILTDRWGQTVAHFQFLDLPATHFSTVTMRASARLFETRYFIYPERVGELSDIPAAITDLYLVDDTKFSMQDSTIQAAVREAVGDETNPYWIGRKVYNYVIDHLYYELSGGWNVAPRVLERGNGSCSEYSFVYIAMCRAAGLPARYAGSIAVRGDDASYDDVYHRWVEIYLPNYGWIPVDPSRGDKESPALRANSFGYLSNRLLVTTVGGGGSEYLEWGYNANERWTAQGRCKIAVENFAEWTPVVLETE